MLSDEQIRDALRAQIPEIPSELRLSSAFAMVAHRSQKRRRVAVWLSAVSSVVVVTAIAVVVGLYHRPGSSPTLIEAAVQPTTSAASATAEPSTPVKPLIATAGPYVFTLPAGWEMVRPTKTVDLAAAGQPISGTNYFFTAATPGNVQQFSVTVSVGEIGRAGNQAIPPNADKATTAAFGRFEGTVASWTDAFGANDTQIDVQAAPATHITIDATGVTIDVLTQILTTTLR